LTRSLLPTESLLLLPNQIDVIIMNFKKNKVFRLIIFNENEIQAEINKGDTVRIIQDH
jgi:hypothetical protein